MSRSVPVDEALSDVNRRYLRGLGAHGMALEARLDAAFPPDPEKIAAFDLEERKALSKINGTGLNTSDQNFLVDENARLRAEIEALKAAQAAKSNVPSYTGWSKAQLEAEIDRVNTEDPDAGLVKGKVAEMVGALSEYFTEDVDDDPDGQ